MPERRTTDLLLLRSRSRSRMLRSQSETRSGERRTSRRRRKLYRRKSSRIPSRASQESSASSTERAVWSKRIHELNTFLRDNILSTVVETPEQKDSRRRSRSRSKQPRRHKIRRYLHRSRGKKKSGARGRGERQPSIHFPILMAARDFPIVSPSKECVCGSALCFGGE